MSANRWSSGVPSRNGETSLPNNAPHVESNFRPDAPTFAPTSNDVFAAGSGQRPFFGGPQSHLLHNRHVSDNIASPSATSRPYELARPRAFTTASFRQGPFGHESFNTMSSPSSSLSRSPEASWNGEHSTVPSGRHAAHSGSPELTNRIFRPGAQQSIPESYEGPLEQGQQSTEASEKTPKASPPTTSGGRETSGGVQLPKNQGHTQSGSATDLYLRTANLSLRPTQTLGNNDSRSQHTSDTASPVTARSAPTEASSSPSVSRKVTSEPTSESISEARLRAKELAEFIKSGALEDSGPGGQPTTPHQQNAISLPHAQWNAQPVVHGCRVLPERPPYPDMKDPLVPELVQSPNFDTLVQYLPFEDNTQSVGPIQAGVVRISDIPYNTTRAEIVAFFGRNARFLTQPAGSPFYAIHIMMERGSAKSMDCFVEFEDEREAEEAVRRTMRQQQNGQNRKPRIGDRVVQVTLSSQAEFMQTLFPRAKCISWDGQNPVVVEKELPFSTGFKGFVTNEEMHMVAKFATTPNRSRFAGKHIQRTYESMISLINKYPWWSTDLYTLGERNAIFGTACTQIGELAGTIRSGQGSMQLTPQLLEELLYVGLSCPAFSERQRKELYEASTAIVGMPRYLSAFVPVWPFEALQRNIKSSEHLVDYYMQFLQPAAYHDLDFMLQQMVDRGNPCSALAVLLGHSSEQQTFRETIRREMDTVMTCLQHAVEAALAHRQHVNPE